MSRTQPFFSIALITGLLMIAGTGSSQEASEPDPFKEFQATLEKIILDGGRDFENLKNTQTKDGSDLTSLEWTSSLCFADAVNCTISRPAIAGITTFYSLTWEGAEAQKAINRYYVLLQYLDYCSVYGFIQRVEDEDEDEDAAPYSAYFSIKDPDKKYSQTIRDTEILAHIVTIQKFDSDHNLVKTYGVKLAIYSRP